MLSLNLGARPLVTLPASSFTDRADAYVCDKCGRDIAKHFRPGQSHAWGPMGRERYRCLCGQKYLPGATEWDHLGDRERSRRIKIRRSSVEREQLGALRSDRYQTR